MKMFKSFIAVFMALVMCMSFASVAFAADKTETDADNGVTTGADAFAIGDKVTGKINGTDDVDYFTFTIAKAGLVTVTVNHAAKEDAIGTYFNISILNEDGKALASFEVAAKNAAVSSPAFGAAAGKYFVKVTKGTVLDTTVEYTLSASIDEKALCEYEVNDTRDKATVIDLSTKTSLKKYAGSIPASNADEITDTDYYKFSIKNPGYVYIFVENDASAKGAYILELETYSEGNNGVADWKKFGKFNVAKTDSTVKSPSIGVSGPTDYYLSVTGTEGGYKLYVVYMEDTSSEAEYNDSIAYANALAEGKFLYCSLFDENDVDYFAFNVAAKTKYTVKLKADAMTVTSDGQWKITVLNSKGEAVTETATATKASAVEVQLAGLEAGKYYVKVESGDINNTNLYTVELVNGGQDKDNMSFKELLGSLDWNQLWSNFSSWIGQINFTQIIKDIVASIVKLVSNLG